MIDIHSHILPGIDDGPRDWDGSLALCRSVFEIGIRTSVATPHFIDGVYENHIARTAPLVRELNERLAVERIELNVLTGAEVDFSSRHVSERTDELPLLGHSRAVLLEMPVAVIPPAIAETIFTLRSRSVTPVIAHPERNEILQGRPELAKEWIDAGALLQVDGDSLLGVWGHHTRRCAEKLLLAGYFHAMASDTHSVAKRPPRLHEAVDRAIELVGEDARKLVTTGPEAILSDAIVPTPLYQVDTQARQRSGHVRRGRLFGGLFDRFRNQI